MRWLLFVLGGLMVVPCLASGAAPPRPRKELYPDKGPVSAFVVGTRLYTMRVYKRSVWKAEFESYIGDWFVQPDACAVSLLGTGPGVPELREVPELGSEDCLYRWRISQGCFWSTGYPAGERTALLRVPMTFFTRAVYKPDVYDCGLGMAPIHRAAFRAVWWDRVPSRRFRASPWDFLPDSGNRLHTFLLWKGELLVWRARLNVTDINLLDQDGDARWDGKKTVDGEDEYPPLFRLKTDLREHFLTHADDKHFFFVTASGKVHCWPKDGKTKRTRLIWDDARPVRLLVTDAATGRTFAFAHRQGPPTKDAPDVYFALAEQPVPVACPRVEGKGEVALLAAARLLIKAKKITLRRPGAGDAQP